MTLLANASSRARSTPGSGAGRSSAGGPRAGRLPVALVGLALVAAGTAGGPLLAQIPESAGPELSQRFTDWLDSVDPLITQDERAAFLRLRRDYQRDAFIREFWRVRDPHPETARNEARERWEINLGIALSDYGGLTDARAQILLVHGKPARRVEVRCGSKRIPAEIWLYEARRTVQARTVLVFVRPLLGTGPASLWVPGRSGSIEGSIRAARGCMNGSMLIDVVSDLRALGDEYDRRLALILAKPRPRSLEWVTSFTAETTDLPADAEPFPADVRLDFLGRHRSRTVLQGTVTVDPAEASRADLAGYRSYDFDLVGEIVRQDSLLESFRYKFAIPVHVEDGSAATTALAPIPMAFQRYLRPGDYTLALRLRDINGDRYFRWEEALSVPRLDQDLQVESQIDDEVAAIFREATAAVATGETSIRLVPPTDSLLTGFVRFDTVVTGDEIERVEFLLDDVSLLTKNRPPFNVEIDLGPFPKPHLLRVKALDGAGGAVADDEITINAGSYRFSISLIEPRAGRRYTESLRVRADVVVPESATLERVEIFLDERLSATLYQEPFVHPVALSGESGSPVGYVRAVAYLTDGNKTEDVVFVNGPDLLESMEVEFVELYASVTDRDGELVRDLRREEVLVEEDGTRQSIARLERVEDLPIHVAVLIDNSASMRGALDTTRRAALGFFEQTIGQRDRAAVITFNRFPNVTVKLTNDLRQLGGGLAGLTAEGQTALFDSVMFGLYYFAGVTGQRALLVLSDGKDEVSRFTAAETIEYARRAGVTVYSIGLGADAAKRFLTELAEDTGGKSYFVQRIDQLAEIYAEIERDLRSQYLIAYQSTNTLNDGRFRRLEVKVRRPGSLVKTMSGYYP